MYSKNKMTVKNSNNGNEPEIYTFGISGFVNIETKGTKQVVNFRIEPNGGSSGHSGNGSEETELESVSDDIQTGIELEVDQNSDLVDNQEIGIGVEDNYDVSKTMLLPVTKEDIAKEIQDFVFLTKTGIRILVALTKKGEKGSLTRDEMRKAGIATSNISNILNGLFKSRLIYFDGKKIIKPNLEKIAASCPWLYSEKIQDIVEIELDFRIGKSVQRVLYLSDKYSDGLSQKTIIDGTGLSKLALDSTIKTMTGYDLIKVINKNGEVIIVPNFFVNQTKKDLITSQELAVTETAPVQEAAEAEEQTVDFNIDEGNSATSQESIVVKEDSVQKVAEAEELTLDTGEKDSATSQEPIVVDTVPVQEIVKAEPIISINTTEGFNREKLESFVNMIKRGFLTVKLQTLSSQFKTGIKGGGISKLLDAINNEIEIEIVDTGTGEVITSWKPKYFKSKSFKSVVFENLEIRTKAINLEKKDIKMKDAEGQETNPILNVGQIGSENDNGISKEEKKEQEREDTIGKIKRMIATPNLGISHKVVLSILLDNYLDNNSLKMEMSDLVENAHRQKLWGAQIKSCFGGLQALKFIKKPNKIIELNIKA